MHHPDSFPAGMSQLMMTSTISDIPQLQNEATDWIVIHAICA